MHKECAGCGRAMSGSFAARSPAGTFRYVQCESCGLAALSHETARDLSAYYRHEYASGYRDSTPEAASLNSLPARWNFGRVARRLDRLTPGRRLLDVGCGSGVFLSLMADRGWEVTGLEPNEAAAAALGKQHGLRIVNAAISQADFPSGSFDVVTLFDVIEHLADPAACLQQIYTWLRPGGILVISTPNVEALEHRIFGPDWFGLQPPDHLWLFSRSALERTIEAAGYQPLRYARSPVGYAWPSIALRFGVQVTPLLEPVLKPLLAPMFVLPALILGRGAQLEAYALRP